MLFRLGGRLRILFYLPSPPENASIFTSIYQFGAIRVSCDGGFRIPPPRGRFRWNIPFPLPVLFSISRSFFPRRTIYCSAAGSAVCVALSCLARFDVLYCLFGVGSDHSSMCSIISGWLLGSLGILSCVVEMHGWCVHLLPLSLPIFVVLPMRRL